MRKCESEKARKVGKFKCAHHFLFPNAKLLKNSICRKLGIIFDNLLLKNMDLGTINKNLLEKGKQLCLEILLTNTVSIGQPRETSRGSPLASQLRHRLRNCLVLVDRIDSLAVVMRQVDELDLVPLSREVICFTFGHSQRLAVWTQVRAPRRIVRFRRATQTAANRVLTLLVSVNVVDVVLHLRSVQIAGVLRRRLEGISLVWKGELAESLKRVRFVSRSNGNDSLRTNRFGEGRRGRLSRVVLAHPHALGAFGSRFLEFRGVGSECFWFSFSAYFARHSREY